VWRGWRGEGTKGRAVNEGAERKEGGVERVKGGGEEKG